MKTLNLLLGPLDVKATFERVAAVHKTIHKFQVQVELDEVRDEIVSVSFYPVDTTFRQIPDANGDIIMAHGCPYPPDCDPIFKEFLKGNVSGRDFADCIQRINDVSKDLK
jgi:hypothetical protein